eukprot:763929-Hanusia_phi.AAC.1
MEEILVPTTITVTFVAGMVVETETCSEGFWLSVTPFLSTSLPYNVSNFCTTVVTPMLGSYCSCIVTIWTIKSRLLTRSMSAPGLAGGSRKHQGCLEGDTGVGAKDGEGVRRHEAFVEAALSDVGRVVGELGPQTVDERRLTEPLIHVGRRRYADSLHVAGRVVDVGRAHRGIGLDPRHTAHSVGATGARILQARRQGHSRTGRHGVTLYVYLSKYPPSDLAELRSIALMSAAEGLGLEGRPVRPGCRRQQVARRDGGIYKAGKSAVRKEREVVGGEGEGSRVCVAVGRNHHVPRGDHIGLNAQVFRPGVVVGGRGAPRRPGSKVSLLVAIADSRRWVDAALLTGVVVAKLAGVGERAAGVCRAGAAAAHQVARVAVLVD